MKSALNENSQSTILENRISELEMRTVFLEETVEALNAHLTEVSQEFTLAKQAMQHLHSRLQQLQSHTNAGEEFLPEPPPPHY